MAELRFEWDPRKAAANRRKHHVSFEDAETVFADENALLMADADHQSTEDRFVILGLSAALKHVGRVPLLPRKGLGHSNHFGSARDAGERKQYAERWRP